MIGVTKLLCGRVTPGDALRYGRESAALPPSLLQFSSDKKPVVVWNLTRRCNLHCAHCYFEAQDKEYPGELTTEEGKRLIDSLAGFGVPVILFSGGEPLMRDDIYDLLAYAGGRGIRTVLSTNGTLITSEIARKINKAGVSYVGISLDGLEDIHDRFRARKGAFQSSLEGIRHCQKRGVKVGVRFTMTKQNFHQIGDMFDLVAEEKIPRLCFYHLVYAGRGGRLRDEDLTPELTRRQVDLIFDRTVDLHIRGLDVDVLIVDNHTDGVYLYLRLEREQPERAPGVYQLLLWNGGNSSGVGIASIDYLGYVHADQFWQHYSFGSIRKREFADIWEDTSDPLMRGLKNKKAMVKGRCARCRYVDICAGNLRVRAEAVYGDVWAEDPACYLTDKEIETG